MPLKIIHHKEQEIEQEKKAISLNIEENLTKMFFFCENIINVANLIFKKTNLSELIEIIDNDSKENKDYFEVKCYNLEGFFFENNNKFAKLIDLFSLIFGKKVSLLEAISKTTTIMQKIAILANDFGISLNTKEKTDCNVLTDDDIDIMVQMVKDFGEEQIRKDAKECREKLSEERDLKDKKHSEVDIYDIYHNESMRGHDKQ